MNIDFEKSFLEYNSIIIKKAKTYIPVLLFIAAALVFVIALSMNNENGTKMPTLMIAFILLVIAIIKLFVTTKSLIYQPTNEILTQRELYFEQNMKDKIVGLIEKGDINTIIAQDKNNPNLPVKLTMYTTASQSIIICRLYNFVPYTYEAITDYKVIKK